MGYLSTRMLLLINRRLLLTKEVQFWWFTFYFRGRLVYKTDVVRFDNQSHLGEVSRGN